MGSVLEEYDKTVQDLFLEWFVITAYSDQTENFRSEMLQRITRFEPSCIKESIHEIAVEWSLAHDPVWRADLESLCHQCDRRLQPSVTKGDQIQIRIHHGR